jgi:cytochrome b561
MPKRMHYGRTAKALHWSIVVLLAVQYSIGWLMPDVHAGPPGIPMTWHISIGLAILALIVGEQLEDIWPSEAAFPQEGPVTNVTGLLP